MTHATSPKTFSAVSVGFLLLSVAAGEATAQDLARANQDELASFYGRMNVVVGSGARAFGMGGAFLARADDATAASWNPAGLSYLRRTEVSAVGVHSDFSQHIPRFDVAAVPPAPVTSVDRLRGSVADFIGAVHPLRIKGRSGALQLSYQRSFSFTGDRRSEGTAGKPGFVPNGGTILPTDFTVAGKGGFDTLSLSSGFEVHPRLRVGVAVNRWINGFSQEVVRPNRRIESDWKIAGTNLNFGLLFTPAPKVNVGAVLKTAFRAGIDLTKTRVDFSEGSKGDSAPAVPVNRTNVEIRFPRVYGVGVSFRPTNTVTLSADFTRTAWSAATITNFFSLAQSSGGPAIDEYPRPLPFPAIEEGANGQADTNQVRIGGEWVLRLGGSGAVLLPLRGGFFLDGQPVAKRLSTTRDGPVSEFKPKFSGLTAGVGVTVRGTLLDIAYIRETGSIPASRAGNGVFDAATKVRYDRLFASLMVRFGPRR